MGIVLQRRTRIHAQTVQVKCTKTRKDFKVNEYLSLIPGRPIRRIYIQDLLMYLYVHGDLFCFFMVELVSNWCTIYIASQVRCCTLCTMFCKRMNTYLPNLYIFTYLFKYYRCILVKYLHFSTTQIGGEYYNIEQFVVVLEPYPIYIHRYIQTRTFIHAIKKISIMQLYWTGDLFLLDCINYGLLNVWNQIRDTAF